MITDDRWSWNNQMHSALVYWYLLNNFIFFNLHSPLCGHLSLFLSLYSCQMCYSDFWTLFNWIYIDERWKGTYWKNITHRDKYFPLNQRWKCAYAAYGGFLLHYTAGGMYHILEYFLFYLLFTLYVFCGILWVLLLFVYDIVCLSSLSGPLFYFFLFRMWDQIIKLLRGHKPLKKTACQSAKKVITSHCL